MLSCDYDSTEFKQIVLKSSQIGKNRFLRFVINITSSGYSDYFCKCLQFIRKSLGIGQLKTVLDIFNNV